MNEAPPKHVTETVPMEGEIMPANAQKQAVHKPNVIPLGQGSQNHEIVPGSAMANAMVQEAVAKVQATIMLAKQFPRDRIKCLENILNSCQRPRLAEQGLYEYAKGGSKVTGPSIRLAEAIAQNWGNFEFGWDEVSRGRNPDGSGYSEIVVQAWDAEVNTKSSTKFQVRHWRDTKAGGYPLRDEREIYENNANQASRRLRARILALIPGDVIDEAVDQCETTLRAKINITPERIANMVNLFDALGVKKDQLEKRIQSRIEAITPAQMLSLTKIYNSINDGISSPQEWFDAVEVQTATETTKGVDKVAAKLQKDKESKKTDSDLLNENSGVKNG